MKNKLVSTLRVTLFSMLGVLLLGYATYYKRFAELHIQFPFVDFPIFIGEIVLAIALACLFIKWKTEQKSFNGWYAWVLAFAAFVIIKAFLGYSEAGAFALRTAAVFYYLLFAFVCYEYFVLTPLSQKTVLVFLTIIFCVEYLLSVQSYYFFPVIITYLMLAFRLKEKWLRISVILLLLAWPLNSLFESSRSHIVSLCLTFAFLWYVFSFHFLKGKTKVVVCVCSIALLLTGLYMYGNKRQLKSLLSFEKIRSAYDAQMRVVKEREAKFIPRDLEPAVYQPEARGLFDYLSSQIKYGTEEPIVFVDLDNMLSTNVIDASRDLIDTINQGIQPQPPHPGEALPSSSQERVLSDREDESRLRVPQVVVKEIKPPELVIPEENFTWLERDMGHSLSNELRIFNEGGVSYDQLVRNMKHVVGMSWDNRIGRVIQKQLVQQGVSTEDTTALIEEAKEEFLSAYASRLDEKIRMGVKTGVQRDENVEYNNIVFRLFIWKDMFAELLDKKPILGFSFAQPLRSRNIEISWMAMDVWLRDGWISAHNSWLFMLYRGGVVAVLLISILGLMMKDMLVYFVKSRNIVGVLWLSIIIYWFTMAHFLVFFEVPYTAIPCWVYFGALYAYFLNKQRQEKSGEC